MKETETTLSPRATHMIDAAWEHYRRRMRVLEAEWVRGVNLFAINRHRVQVAYGDRCDQVAVLSTKLERRRQVRDQAMEELIKKYDAQMAAARAAEPALEIKRIQDMKEMQGVKLSDVLKDARTLVLAEQVEALRRHLAGLLRDRDRSAAKIMRLCADLSKAEAVNGSCVERIKAISENDWGKVPELPADEKPKG